MITTGLPKIMGNLGMPLHRFHFGIDRLSDKGCCHPVIERCVNDTIRMFKWDFHWGRRPMALIEATPCFKEFFDERKEATLRML